MFSDIHINQVLLAELVDDANCGLATVSGDVRKRSFPDKSVKMYVFSNAKAQFYPKYQLLGWKSNFLGDTPSDRHVPGA